MEPLRNSSIAEIAQAWRTEIDAVGEPQQSLLMQMFNMVVMTTPAALPPRLILNCATSFRHPDGETGTEFSELFNEFREANKIEEIPETASNFQLYLCLKANAVQCYEDFIALLDWVADANDDTLLAEFDAILTWPLVSGCGAFVHSAWAAEGSKGEVDWSRWTTALARAWDIAKAKRMHAFGHEVARALSIIQSEYLQDPVAGIAVLEKAEADFAPSAVLAEQLVNVYYQTKDYEKALDAWKSLIDSFGKNAITDAFAFRRAALCGAELSKWATAAQLFEDGARTFPSRSALHTRCCLLAEAALAFWFGGENRAASKMMVMCVKELPELEVMEGDRQWEAALRMMFAIAQQIAGQNIRTIEGSPALIKPGQVSAPALTVETRTDRQSMRVKLFVLEVFANELNWTAPDSEAELRVASLADDEELTVRWQATIKILEHQVLKGVDESYVSLAISYVNAFLALHQLAPSQFGDASKNAEPAMVGVLVFGLLCTPKTAHGLSQKWLEKARRESLSIPIPVLEVIEKCFALTLMVSGNNVRSGQLGIAERCGAALNVLANEKRTALMTASAQGILVAVLHSCGIFRLFGNSNVQQILVAKFATQWDHLVGQPHMLVAPSISVPSLMSEIKLARTGNGRLKQLLAAGAFAGGAGLTSIIEKL